MPASTATASNTSQDHASGMSSPMLGLFMQISVALALVLFVRDLVMLAPLDHALMTAAGAGFVVYFALVGGYLVVRHILDTSAEAPASEDAPSAPPEAAAAPEAASETPVEPAEAPAS